MSLGVRVITAVLVLAAALSARLGFDSLTAWQATGQALALRQANAVSARLVSAAGAMAAERGLVNGLLADPAARTDPARARVAALRATADAALDTALAPTLVQDTAPVRAARQTLQALRVQSDAAMAGTSSAPPGWFAGATAAIDAVVNLRRAVDAAATNTGDITRLIALRDRLGELSEFGGRERGFVNGLIAAGVRPTPAQLTTLGALGGRIDGAWASLAVGLDDLPGDTIAKLQAARQAWFTTFGPTRKDVLTSAAAGTAWPLAAADWFSQSSAAIDALLAAQAQAGAAIDAALEQQRSARGQVAALALAGLVLAVLLSAAIWLYMLRGVARPLARTIETIDRLAAGELDIDIPASRARDEIGRLLIATAHFRDTARQAKSLADAQEQLRAESETLRARVMRQIGDAIEDVTERAVGNVRDVAGALRARAGNVRDTSGAIAESAAAAAGDAALGMQSTDQAAQGARELTAAIGEIAQQMERAALATSGAVARVDEAQKVFEALSVSVGEIGEVAGLINQIAGRTNLLALNATIEAARAGEAGKGFAVVASEVKALARETGRSTERITQRIGAIDAVTRQAMTAMEGITAQVGDLDRIASAVAAAIEEQSSATAGIAEAVGASSAAATRVAERMQDVAGQTRGSESASAEMAGMSAEVADKMAELKSSLVQMLRTQVTELDRRATRRVATRLPARLLHAGTVLSGSVIDASPGGARVVLEQPAALPAGAAVVLEARGLPRCPATVVTCTDTSLHVTFASATPDERAAIAHAIDRLDQTAAA